MELMTGEPKPYDIMVLGKIETGSIDVIYAAKPEVINHFPAYVSEAKTKFPTIKDLLSVIQTHYNVEEQWIIDCWCNNAMCAALDMTSMNLHGAAYVYVYGKNLSNQHYIHSLLWCAFLAEKQLTNEMPDIFSRVLEKGETL